VWVFPALFRDPRQHTVAKAESNETSSQVFLVAATDCREQERRRVGEHGRLFRSFLFRKNWQQCRDRACPVDTFYPDTCQLRCATGLLRTEEWWNVVDERISDETPCRAAFEVVDQTVQQA